MRFLVECDICGGVFKTEKMSLPKNITLIEGYDMCDECSKEYLKRKRGLIKVLAKEMENKRERRKIKNESTPT